jgi:hypothetical protein
MGLFLMTAPGVEILFWGWGWLVQIRDDLVGETEEVLVLLQLCLTGKQIPPHLGIHPLQLLPLQRYLESTPLDHFERQNQLLKLRTPVKFVTLPSRGVLHQRTCLRNLPHRT